MGTSFQDTPNIASISLYVNKIRHNLWHHILDIFKVRFKTDAGLRDLPHSQLSKKSQDYLADNLLKSFLP